MKEFGLIFCFCLFFTFLLSCERDDCSEEIENPDQQALLDNDLVPEPDEENDEPDKVIDGNMWSKISPLPLSWEEAVAYCENLDELNYSDWRLPTVDELRTLIQHCPNHESDGPCTMTDKCLTNPSGCEFSSENCSCCDFAPDGFYNKLEDNNTPLWSSLVCMSNPVRSWIAGFEYGCITTAAMINDGCRDVYARCVRLAE